jgi:tRNA 5-methylaminomethyl-2-thiouridine biosynthesis bifunctional protein
MSDDDHTANLERLQRMLPGYCADATPENIGGRVGFRPVSPDKLPIIGQLYRAEARPQGRDFSAVERWPGLHVASGYGARGLVWSMLMAELLASQLEGEPLPLESELAATVDPARFLLRKNI